MFPNKEKTFEEICAANQKEFFFISIKYSLVQKSHPHFIGAQIEGTIYRYNMHYFRHDANVDYLKSQINTFIDEHNISHEDWRWYQICLYTRPHFFFKEGLNQFGRDCADFEFIGILSKENKFTYLGYQSGKFSKKLEEILLQQQSPIKGISLSISGYELKQPDRISDFLFPNELQIDYRIPTEKWCVSCDNHIKKYERYHEELYHGYKIYWHVGCKWPDYGGDLLKFATTEKKIRLMRKCEENYPIFL